MMARMDGPVVILGGGSTGEAAAGALRMLEPETPITLVEEGLVGGECSYYACMPSKALLRPPEAIAAARLVPGAAEAVTGTIDVERAFWHRDQVTGGLDDSSQAKWLADRNVELVRGRARVAGPGAVEVSDRTIAFERILVATGSVPTIPPIPGLAEVEHWTNREATSTHEVPGRMIVVGAGPVGCELAQAFGRMGATVTLVDVAERLLPRDDPDAGSLIADVLEGEGIGLRLGAKIERVEPGVRMRLGGGETIAADCILVATGRRANVEGLGLEALGVTISKRGVEVDERLRAAENVWAAGDVTGIAMFTHVGKYQARLAAADMAGRERARRLPGHPGGHVHRSAGGLGRRHVGRRRGRGRARLGGAALDLRAAEAAGSAEGVRRSGSAGAGRRGRGRPRGGGVAGAAHARHPRGGAGRRPARHDPALPHVLGGDPVRRARPGPG